MSEFTEKNHEISTVIQVWDNSSGERVEIKESLDAPYTVSIQGFSYTNELEEEISLDLPCAKLVVKGLVKIIEEIERKVEEDL